jgi:outer membrane protein assembly factor BamB
MGTSLRHGAVAFFLLGLSSPVLLPTAPAHAEPRAKRSSVPLSVTRTWQIPEVTLVLSLPVFWGDHFMAVVQHAPRIVALDLNTGKRIWERPVPAGSMSTEITQVGDRLVVLGDHHLEGVVPSTGETDWTAELPCEPPSTARFARGLAVLACAPRIAPDQPHARTPIIGLDMHSGQIQWQIALARGEGWSQMGQDVYYYLDVIRADSFGPSPGAVVAVDLSTGKALWRRELRDAAGRLAVVGETAIVSTSRVVGLSARTGQVRYEKTLGPDPDVDRLAEDASTELAVCNGNLFFLGRAGIEVMAGETGKRREFLRYPTSPRASRADRSRNWFLLCEGSRILVASERSGGQSEVYLREGNEWRQVHGLAPDEYVMAFANGQILVESDAGLAGYSFTQAKRAPR